MGLLLAAGIALLTGGSYVRAEISKIRAERLVAKKEYRAASVHLEEVLAVAPRCRKAILLKLKSDLLCGNFESLDEDFERAKNVEFENDALYKEVDAIAARLDKAQSALEKGMALVEQDRNAEALPHLELASKSFPEGGLFPRYFLQCRSSVEFDRADYDAALVTAREIAQSFPSDALSEGFVASALAAKYAVTGDSKWAIEAAEQLSKAESLVASDAERAEFLEYRARIEHRLRTREVIDKAEYDRRFKE